MVHFSLLAPGSGTLRWLCRVLQGPVVVEGGGWRVTLTEKCAVQKQALLIQSSEPTG